jgi:trimethylamine--corrinoid protein Co-methyltransferase
MTNQIIGISELVHEKSIEILEEVGFCVPEKGALKRLEKVGFIIDRATDMVRIPPDLCEEGLKHLPKDLKLYDRSGKQPISFNNESNFMGAGTPVYVFDLQSGERRYATRRDVRQLVAVQHALPQVDIVRPTVTATDQGECSDLVEIAELLLNTDKPIVHRTLSSERIDAAVEILAAVAGGEAALRSHPNFATLYCPISPGYFTEENIRCLLGWAEYGVPITLLSMAMGGASAPATLLGELIVINTDILAWLVALEILYPGTPLIYGSVSSVLDMRTGILPLGAPERGMVNSGAAIMGRFYGIPSMCGGLSADAKQLDIQAGFEKTITAVPLLLEGASIIYGVGATDAGSTISYTQMVFDNEIIAGLRRMMQGIEQHDVEEEVEIIKANTPRGNFLREKHTRKNYARHWRPEILNREAYDTWLENKVTIEQYCYQRAVDILGQHQPPRLPANVEAEIERILRQYLGSEFHLD